MKTQKQGIELYIPLNTKQEGSLSVQGRVRIDGIFIGDLYTESSLEIGPKGVLEGNANVAFADISGDFKGSLLTHGLCILRSSSSFEGLLDSSLAEFERDCQVKGEIRIQGKRNT